jgi:2-dehydro-3-deoxy-D-arabinonate dehydratase
MYERKVSLQGSPFKSFFLNSTHKPYLNPMKLYKLTAGTLLETDNDIFLGPELDWDQLLGREHLPQLLRSEAKHWESISSEKADELKSEGLLAPMGNQEIWAAGVTYYRSRTARMEESQDAGGADFYDKVYEADRPELFFKATASRVSNPGETVNVRKDSTWDVPEPELTLLISPSGKVQGFTVGNDMSSRSIEGENPLYLPQAKVYQGCAAVGPCILIQEEMLPDSSKISLEILRNGQVEASGETGLDQMKRKPQELADWLFRANTFPIGCLMMTGTGIVPDNFTLEKGDVVKITIDGIGTLENTVGKI